MNTKHLRTLLLVAGMPLFAFAAVRFALSAQGSEFSPPEHGFAVGFHIDPITFIVGMVGALLCALSLLLRSRRA
jgi:hypothetical protein